MKRFVFYCLIFINSIISCSKKPVDQKFIPAHWEKISFPQFPKIQYERPTFFDPHQSETLKIETKKIESQLVQQHLPSRTIIPWKTPGAIISKTPKLTGKQMGVVMTPGVEPLGYEKQGNVKVFELIAQPIEQLIVDTKKSTYANLVPKENIWPGTMHRVMYQKVRAWGYNGSTPGPTIECTQGDTIRVIVKNELPQPTSIHWHGIELPNAQDGAAPETQAPIMPGESFTYEFTLYQSGTFMYHSGFNVMRQNHMGLQGLVVVHPKKYEVQKPDKQFAINLQQWSIPPGNEYLNLTTMEFNWFTFNGKAAPNIPVLEVNQGDRVRIRFGNIIMASHPIHIHGYTWYEVGNDGGDFPKRLWKKSSTIFVQPGKTQDIEFVAWNPGLWRLHCHKLHHVVNAHSNIPMSSMSHGGMYTLVHVIPKKPDAPWQHPNMQGTENYS